MNEFIDSFRTMLHRFLWSSHTVTRTAPHIRDANNVQRLWSYFVIATIPALAIGLWSLGHQTNLAIVDMGIHHPTGWRADFLYLG